MPFLCCFFFVTLSYFLIELPANFRFRQTIKVVICCGLIYCAQKIIFLHFYIVSVWCFSRGKLTSRSGPFLLPKNSRLTLSSSTYSENSKVYDSRLEKFNAAQQQQQKKLIQNSLLRQRITFNSFENINFHTSCVDVVRCTRWMKWYSHVNYGMRTLWKVSWLRFSWPDLSTLCWL